MLTADLKNVLQTTDLIVTVGNELRSDDAVGPYIFEKCQMSNIKCPIINAGNKPENIIEEAVAKKPKKIVIIDAADFGGKPGEARMISNEHIPETTLSTHAFPLKVIAKIIEDNANVQIDFLGIQPKDVGLGEGLSSEIKQTADEIIKILGGK